MEVFVFVGLNWEDAPSEQFAVKGVDYKVTDSFQEHDQDVFIGPRCPWVPIYGSECQKLTGRPFAD